MNQKDIETLAIALPEDILKAKWCGDFDRAFHLIRPSWPVHSSRPL